MDLILNRTDTANITSKISDTPNITLAWNVIQKFGGYLLCPSNRKERKSARGTPCMAETDDKHVKTVGTVRRDVLLLSPELQHSYHTARNQTVAQVYGTWRFMLCSQKPTIALYYKAPKSIYIMTVASPSRPLLTSTHKRALLPQFPKNIL